MNLQKLFTAQAELDAYIEQQHPTLPGENRLEKKVLALLVELGECANEWRGFKFWSNRQEPSRLPIETCYLCDGTGRGEVTIERSISDSIAIQNKCSECRGKGMTGGMYPLLEEYVDCLHFILSIGNELSYSRCYDNYELGGNKVKTNSYDFTELFIMSSQIDSYTAYDELIESFLFLGESLGFTDEQIEQAYWKKYEINKQRQVDGY